MTVGDTLKKEAAKSAAGFTPVRVPEPDLTPAELIRRAAALREEIRADQDAADERGHHSPELQWKFVDAGFYRTIQPRLFGGYEFDYTTYYKLMAEISRGNPGTGWCITLGASHAALIAAHFPPEAQAELFGADGHFIAPHRAVPAGPTVCEKTEGGYVVDGVWGYCSGVPYATHFIGNIPYKGEAAPSGMLTFIVPRAAIEVIDDWGGDAILGMRASGSNSVRVAKTFVPDRFVIPAGAGLWSVDPIGDGTYGTRLHGNPMYLGRMMGPYHASLIAPVIGAARAALDELETIARARTTRHPPIVSWIENTDLQRPFGDAMVMTDSAEALMVRGCEMYMEYCRRWAEDGTEFTPEEGLRLWGVLIQAGRLACDAVNLLFDAASSSATKKGQRIERYYRDAAMYRSHISSQKTTFASAIARLHFGLKAGMHGL